MSSLKSSSTAGGGLVWTQTNLPFSPQDTKLFYKGSEIVDSKNNQTIGGDKNFTGSVTAKTPTLTNELSTKGYVDTLNSTSVKSVTGTLPIVVTTGVNPRVSINNASSSAAGAMSAADKSKLDGLPMAAVNKTGDTMTGSLVLSGTANLTVGGKIATTSNGGIENTDDNYGQRMVFSGSQGYFQAGKKDRDINDQNMIFSGWMGTPNSTTRFMMKQGVNPAVIWSGTNYDILHRGNMPTPADIGTITTSEIDSKIDAVGTGFKTRVITLPSGSPATGYIPVIFSNIASDAEIYISTAGGQSSIPMNNCSFNGIVRAGGWGDGGSYATGMFTIYQTNERAIHSVHGPSESTNAAVFYVETRAFPITVKASTIVGVSASATNLTYGTSVFAVNGQEGVGNTKTMTLANFASGTGIYKGSSIVQNQDEQDARYLLKGGDTMTGQLVVSQSGNSSIVINSTTSNDSQLQFQNQGKLRWLIQRDAVAESGSNVGSDLNIFGYNDDGTFGGSVLKIRRSTRQVEFTGNPLSNIAQSTAANALTRRDFVEAQDALKVSKSGDTMTDNLVFGVSGKGILLTNASIGTGNGLYVGTGDGASDVKTNIQIKSWYGVGIAPSGTNPDSINNIWFNARNGDISTIGDITSKALTLSSDLISTRTSAAITFKVPSAQSNFILGQTGSGDTWTNSWFVGRGGPSEDVSLYSYTRGTFLRLEADRITFNKSAYVGTAKVLVSTDEYIWKNRGQQSDLGIASAVLPGYFSFNPGAASSPDNTLYGHGFAVNPGSNGAAGVWSSQFAVTHGTPNKLWHRTGINGAAQGNWKRIYTSDDAPTADELGVVSRSGDTMTGLLTITKGDDAITLNPASGTASYILGKQGGTSSWYVGKGSSSSNDITLNSYVHSTFISLASDRINVNKNIVTSVAQSALANALTRKDYVDGAISAGDALQVSKSGDSMSGNLTAPAVFLSSSQNSSASALTRKDYVDGQIAGRAPSTHNHTAAQANSDIIGGTTYAIGSYILAQKLNGSIAVYGSNVAGSQLLPSSAGNRYWDGNTCPGTWKCMGYAYDTSAEVDQRASLFIRIS